MKKVISLLLAASFAFCILAGSVQSKAEDSSGPKILCFVTTEKISYNGETPSNKSTYTYDAAGNCTAREQFRYDVSSSSYIPMSKANFTYDAANRVLTQTDYAWLDASSEYVVTSTDSYNYNANGDPTLHMYVSYAGKSAVADYGYRWVYTYDAKNNCTASDYAEYDTQTQDFTKNVNKQKCDYQYDGDKITEAIDSLYLNSEWIPTTKNQYTYEGELKKTRTYYMYISKVETPSQREEYTYDANGLVTSELDKIWKAASSEFVNDERHDYQYDANGNVTQIEDYTYEGGTSLNSRKVYTYDANNNITKEESFKLQGISIVPDYKYEYTYDSKGRMTSLIYSEYVGSAYKNSSKEEIVFESNGDYTDSYYYWESGDWAFSGKMEYKVKGIHEKALNPVRGLNPTASTPGYRAAFQCPDCGFYFEDTDKATMIGDDAAYLAWKTTGNGFLPAGSVPPTGDSSNLFWAVPGILSIAGLGFILTRKRHTSAE